MKKIVIIAFISVLLNSCGEFLAPYSPNQYVPRTVDALKEMMVGEVYFRAKDNNDVFFAYNEYMSDNVETTDNEFTNVAESAKPSFDRHKELYCLNPRVFELADVSPGGTLINKDTWKKHFEKILACNVIFDYIDKVKGDEEQKNLVLAEAYFFRAFIYFNFVNIYGEPYSFAPDALGVPIKTTCGYSDEYLKRNTVAEVYKQIISDLENAEIYYSKLDRTFQFQDITRPSLPTLYLLRSRVALYMENWSEAATYAEKAMAKEWKFKLYDLNDKPGNSLTISFVNLTNVNPETFFVYAKSTSLFGIYNTGGIIPKKTGQNQTDKDWNVRLFRVSNELLNSFDLTDLRKTSYTTPEYISAAKVFLDDSYLAQGKLDANPETGVLEGTEINFGMMMRLSEAYLNYAEACAMSGRESEALVKIKELREHRYKSGSNEVEMPNLTGEKLVQYIRNERRKELCFEGHRWFDLRRYGKGFERKWYEKGELMNTITVESQDAAQTLPLNPDVLKNNPALVQNRTWEMKY